ncbi:MAG TPA: YHS domain-containing protein [Fimbriimonadaceae bacterium]|nr:YHS domain-containing protein [Fimbriimonadaceae bacterium]
MLTTALATIVMGFSGPPPIYCPATLEKIEGKPALTVDYGGILFETCCAGCGNPVMQKPGQLLADAIKARKTVGQFEYDPVTGLKIDLTKATIYSDYRSVRYFFTSDDEKKTFDASPSKFVSDVKSEAYFCPVTKTATDEKSAGSYADYKGTRYFFCCGDCRKAFKENPDKFAANAADAVKPLYSIALK